MNTIKAILSNPNFWTALIGVVVAICGAYGLPQGSIEQITAIISATSVLIASILGQNIKQAATIKANAQIEAIKASRQ
jgi:predicted permease